MDTHLSTCHIRSVTFPFLWWLLIAFHLLVFWHMRTNMLEKGLEVDETIAITDLFHNIILLFGCVVWMTMSSFFENYFRHILKFWLRRLNKINGIIGVCVYACKQWHSTYLVLKPIPFSVIKFNAKGTISFSCRQSSTILVILSREKKNTKTVTLYCYEMLSTCN